MQEMLIVWIMATGLLVSKLVNSIVPMWISLIALAALLFNKRGAVS